MTNNKKISLIISSLLMTLQANSVYSTEYMKQNGSNLYVINKKTEPTNESYEYETNKNEVASESYECGNNNKINLEKYNLCNKLGKNTLDSITSKQNNNIIENVANNKTLIHNNSSNDSISKYPKNNLNDDNSLQYSKNNLNNNNSLQCFKNNLSNNNSIQYSKNNLNDNNSIQYSKNNLNNNNSIQCSKNNLSNNNSIQYSKNNLSNNNSIQYSKNNLSNNNSIQYSKNNLNIKSNNNLSVDNIHDSIGCIYNKIINESNEAEKYARIFIYNILFGIRHRSRYKVNYDKYSGKFISYLIEQYNIYNKSLNKINNNNDKEQLNKTNTDLEEIYNLLANNVVQRVLKYFTGWPILDPMKLFKRLICIGKNINDNLANDIVIFILFNNKSFKDFYNSIFGIDSNDTIKQSCTNEFIVLVASPFLENYLTINCDTENLESFNKILENSIIRQLLFNNEYYDMKKVVSIVSKIVKNEKLKLDNLKDQMSEKRINNLSVKIGNLEINITNNLTLSCISFGQFYRWIHNNDNILNIQRTINDFIILLQNKILEEYFNENNSEIELKYFWEILNNNIIKFNIDEICKKGQNTFVQNIKNILNKPSNKPNIFVNNKKNIIYKLEKYTIK